MKGRHFHFLGICGTAMGAVAAALRDRKFVVTGSDDNVYPPMSTFLEEKQIALHSGFRPENIPADADVIVIGNAMTRGNPELEAVLNRKLYYLSLPEVLKQFFLRGCHNLVVTGTHGKTTTTALLAWILTSAKMKPGYVIGGIPRNLGQGALFPKKATHFVIEGDEYDTAFFDKRSKFIHYLPELLIVNNLEFDHADIFPNLDAIKLSFRRLLNIVPQNGMVLLNGDDANCIEVARNCPAPTVTIGFSENCAQRLRDVSYSKRGARFFLGEDEFKVPLLGEFNVRNTAMAVAAAKFYGVPNETINRALARFKGIARRQEVRGEERGVTVIDDFGHHPTAIAQTLKALRQRFPQHRLWAVFEPRSNTTRRAVFQKELPEALSLADGVFVSQIARLEQIPETERLDPAAVMAAIEEGGRLAFYEPNADAIVAKLIPQLRERDVVVVFSNGGFDGIHGKILERLKTG